jgi:N6-adenosine-specific RNA methylase IME4
MNFRKDDMYKNLFKDEDVAFTVDEILSENNYGADLIVTWFKLTNGGRYVSMGISGEFHVPKDQVMYYVPI